MYFNILTHSGVGVLADREDVSYVCNGLICKEFLKCQLENKYFKAFQSVSGYDLVKRAQR